MNKNKLYRDTLKLVKEANRRLARLEKGVDLNKGRYNPRTKRFERKNSIEIINKKGKKIRLKTVNIVSFPAGTWASKKLFDKIESYLGTNRIEINKNMTTSELTVLNKSLKNFLKSKTSTIKGIQEIEENTKSNISNILGDFDSDMLDNSEIETLYNFFEDEDFNYIRQYIPASDQWILLQEAKEKDLNDTNYLDLISRYVEGVYKDEELTKSLLNIYHKFKM